jgi:hypothetical protein
LATTALPQHKKNYKKDINTAHKALKNIKNKVLD